MLRIITERILDIDKELCACFIDWQKAFGRVKMDQIHADPKGKWNGLARKKIDKETVHGSEC
jgi:hypothetical protein